MIRVGMRGLAIIAGLLAALYPYAWGVPLTPEATETNKFLSNLTSGGFAKAAVVGILEDITPVWNLLPFELSPLEDEISRLVERETVRRASMLVRTGVGEIGLTGPLSLSSGVYVPGSASARRSNSSRRPVRLRAKVSPHRIGLSFLLRF
ncbi:MAG: hypothetical protein HYT79_09555 [Elusimicrobia bacterium]|nr:hypothetical protein [Elusimicrobiota bacterium]